MVAGTAPTADTTSGFAAAKEAPTDFSPFIVTLQAAVPVHAPVHPVKAESLLAVALSVTTVPVSNVAVQTPGHEIAAGVLTTLPRPEPETTTARVNVEGVLPTNSRKLGEPVPGEFTRSFVDAAMSASRTPAGVLVGCTSR